MKIRKGKAAKLTGMAMTAVCLLASLSGASPDRYRGYVGTAKAAQASQEEALIIEGEPQALPEDSDNVQGSESGAEQTQEFPEIIVEQVEQSTGGINGSWGAESGGNSGALTENGAAVHSSDSSVNSEGDLSAGDLVDGTQEKAEPGEDMLGESETEDMQGEAETEGDTPGESESEDGTKGEAETEDGTKGEAGTGNDTPGEPETEDDKQGESEPESESQIEPNNEMQSETESESNDREEDPSSPDKEIYLGIDNRHRYAGMKQSFSEGYQPKVKKNTLYLAVPFTASGRLKGDCLTVDLAFSQEENSPFVFKNYQKDVMRKSYTLQNGIMRESADASADADTGTGTDAGTGTGADAGTGTGADAEAGTGTDTGAGTDASRQQAYLYTCEVPLQEGAAAGQYSVTVKAWGYTEAGKKLTLDYQVFVRIPEPKQNAPEHFPSDGGGGMSGGGGGGFSGGGGGTEAEEIIRQPKMLLEACNLSEKGLEAGSKETLQAVLCNRSEVQTMYNLKVVLQTDSKAVRLGRNSFYFSKVAPEGTIELENELSVMPLAEEESVTLTFQFEYEDKKGTAASGTETVTIPIVQPIHMEMETGQIPVALYASDTVELSLKAINLSRTDVYNVRAKLEGAGLFPIEDVFIGNMEAGTQGSGTMRVYIGTRTMQKIGDDAGTQDSEKYGPVSGTITLQYEDSFGETHEITKEYQTEIKKAEVLSLKVDQEPEQNSWWISVFAALIAGLLLLVAVLLWRLRRKSVMLEEARKTGNIA